MVDTPGGPREIHRSVTTGGSFGANPLRLEIGLGAARPIDEIRVTWPASGIVQTFKDAAMDRVYAIREGGQALTEIPLRTFAFGSRQAVAQGAN